MPLVIEELSTTLEIRDEAKIRRLVREEVKQAVAQLGLQSGQAAGEADPSDPAAGGSPQEGG